MKKNQLIIIIIVSFFIIFALFFEITEQKNCYKIGIHKKTDNIYKSLRNIDKCITYDYKSVKWRRSYIVSNIIIVFIFMFIHKKLPTPKEYFLYLSIIFIGYNTMWIHYTETISKDVVKQSRINIKNVKKILKKNVL